MAIVSTRNRNKNKFDKDGKAKKPNWEYRFEMAKVDGKRQHASKSGFKTQKEALEAGTKALAEYLNGGQVHKPTEISVSDYLDQWLKQYVEVNLRTSTQTTYKIMVNKHIKPALGHYKLKSLSPSILQQFMNDQKEKGYSKQYLEIVSVTLKSSLKYAIEPLQLIQTNPMAYIKLPKASKQSKERIILTKEQWHKIIETFHFPNKAYIPLMIAMHTGMRIGEVFGLTWNDIDFVNETITVNKQQIRYNDEKLKWCFAPPKSKASNRTIRIGKTLINALKKEQINQKQNKLMYGKHFKHFKAVKLKDEMYQVIQTEDASDALNLVCIEHDGEWITSNRFRYCSKIINEQLEIPFNFHALRHTHATWLAESGVNPKTLQKRLGHEKIETTLQNYIHDTKAMQDQTVEIFERIVSTL